MTLRPYVFYFFSLSAFLATPIVLAVWYAHDPDLRPEHQTLLLSVEPDEEPSTAFLHLLGFYAPPDQSSEEAGLQQWLGYKDANEQWLAAREAHLAEIVQEINWGNFISRKYEEFAYRKIPYDYAFGFGEQGLPPLAETLECHITKDCDDWMLNASAEELAAVLEDHQLLLRRSQLLWASPELGNQITWIVDAPLPKYTALFDANTLMQLSALYQHKSGNTDTAIKALHALIERQAAWLSGQNDFVSFFAITKIWASNLPLLSTIQDVSESDIALTFTHIDFASSYENAFIQEIRVQHIGLGSVVEEFEAIISALVPASCVPTVTGLFMKNTPSTVVKLDYSKELKVAIEHEDKDNIPCLNFPTAN